MPNAALSSQTSPHNISRLDLIGDDVCTGLTALIAEGQFVEALQRSEAQRLEQLPFLVANELEQQNLRADVAAVVQGAQVITSRVIGWQTEGLFHRKSQRISRAALLSLNLTTRTVSSLCLLDYSNAL